ncbi:MAG: hypothetical protein V1837_00665 [Candidatus Woesearchaeota archaeon]
MKKRVEFLVLILAATLFLCGCAQTEKPTVENKAGLASTEQDVVAPVANEMAMVDCSKTKDSFCFINRMNQCLPVTTKMIGSDGTTSIEMTILGQVNKTCHFQRKINDVMNLECYFPKGTMNMDTIDQTFGNDKGLQKVVDDNCKLPGW